MRQQYHLNEESLDSIQTYLDDPPLPPSAISAGVIQYWYFVENTCPSLARMGLDFCSAPGKFFSFPKYSFLIIL